MPIDVQTFSTHATLRDGRAIQIRSIKPSDKAALREAFGTLSPRSAYFRFLHFKNELSEDELKFLTEVDYLNHVPLVAVQRRGKNEKIIGVARYLRLAGGPLPSNSAEAVVAVSDAQQGRGIGTLLLENLAMIAKENGISEFHAEVLGGNNRMLQVLSHIGCQVQSLAQGGVVKVSFATKEAEEILQLREKQDWEGVVKSIRSLFAPHSVALVGASSRAGSVGCQLFSNLKTAGFKGALYPVNPYTPELDGVKCYPSVSSIPEPVDLAVIAVPASAVEAVLEDCSLVGVKSVVVISAGFSEASAEGQKLQSRLLDLARASGMHVVGPNCLGLINTDPQVSLNATFSPVAATPGSVAMLTQSGGLGIALLDYAERLQIGISSFVSVGNKADLSGNDFIRYWADDPATKVIALYLESFGNPRKFERIVPQVARKTPIVCVKAGRSAAGTRAASSHTAALASPDVAVDALFEEAGVIRAGTLEELFDVVSLLATQPLARGPNVGVVSNAGGPAILLADALESGGLKLPVFSEETLASLKSYLPPQAGLSNPVDMIGSASPDEFIRTLEAVGRDSRIDAVVVVYVPPFISQIGDIVAAIVEGADRVPEEKPVLVIFLSSHVLPQAFRCPKRGKLPCYTFPENAARALVAARRHAAWKERPQGQVYRPSQFQVSAVRAVVEGAKSQGQSWLNYESLAVILSVMGIQLPAAEVIQPELAWDGAKRVGFPLVAKAISAGLLHKSDIGAVIMGLKSGEDLQNAVRTLQERLRTQGLPLEALLLQREIRSGIEMLAGVTIDPTFGPLVMAGFGGVQVELIRDTACRLTPLSDVDAEGMLQKLRCAKLLDGFRGEPPGDRAALVALLMRVSALCEIIPEMREFDLNPIKVLKPGEGVLVLDARLRIQ